MESIGTGLLLTPGQAPWAHGIVESCMKRIKRTFYILQHEDPARNVKAALAMAVRAANVCENVAGFSPMQWAYGRADGSLEPDKFFSLGITTEDKNTDFVDLIQGRSKAEHAYRRAKALERISILHNTKVRQQLREYALGELVFIWRRQVPDISLETGYRKSVKSGWVGPGRVVMSEMPPPSGPVESAGQEPGRKHIIWVLIGTRLYRCSVYSVRPATSQEAGISEFNKALVQPQRIQDLLPSGRYTDLTRDVPSQDLMEDESNYDLPAEPPEFGMRGGAEEQAPQEPPAAAAAAPQTTSAGATTSSSSSSTAVRAATVEADVEVPGAVAAIAAGSRAQGSVAQPSLSKPEPASLAPGSVRSVVSKWPGKQRVAKSKTATTSREREHSRERGRPLVRPGGDPKPAVAVDDPQGVDASELPQQADDSQGVDAPELPQ